jgi:hypothetical protein
MIILADFSLLNLYKILIKSLTADISFVTLNTLSDLITSKNQLLGKVLLDEMVDEGLLIIDESDLDLRYYENTILNYELK